MKLLVTILLSLISFSSYSNNSATGWSGSFLPKEEATLSPLQYEVDYKEEEVRFINKREGNALVGTLTLPQTELPAPAVLLIAGSGPLDRDATVYTHKPFALLAHYLSSRGFIVLRYDKRGVGKSNGSAIATTQELATDAEAALSYLRLRTEVNKEAVGVIGHSEGGIIAPMLDTPTNRLSFMVLLAAPGLQGKELLLQQGRALLQQHFSGEVLITKVVDVYKSCYQLAQQELDDERLKQAVDSVLTQASMDQIVGSFFTKQQNLLLREATTSPWVRYFLRMNPSNWLNLYQLNTPTFALNGALDKQVDASTNLQAIANAFKDNPNFTSKVYPHLNHFFQQAESGNLEEYATLTTSISPEVMSDIYLWISSLLNKKESTPVK